MAEFKFACPHCQQHISATEAYCGLQIQCPSCNGRLIVPGGAPASAPAASAPAQGQQQSPGPLELRHEPAAPPAATSGRTCPSCGTPMGRGAVLCTSCGYNTVTQQKVSARHATSRARSGEPAWYESPWPYIGLTALLTGLFFVLGKQVNQNFFFGLLGTLLLYALAMQIIMLICAFKESVGTGFLCLCIPIFAWYWVWWASDNRTLKILYVFQIVIYLELFFLVRLMGGT